MFDWDESGRLVPWTIEDAEGVDERRASVGLPPLADQVASAQAAAEREGDHQPADPVARRDEAERWAQSVGWRD